MYRKDLTKYATAALAAAACVFVMSGVRAADWNDNPASIAYSNPASLPCHPSLDRGACLKHPERADFNAGVTTVAQNMATESPCHPAVDGGACLKRSK
jgi:hypothetical protein